jgi:hypothetical protein
MAKRKEKKPKFRVHVWLMSAGQWRVALAGRNHFGPESYDGQFVTVVIAERPTRDKANAIAKSLRAALKGIK